MTEPLAIVATNPMPPVAASAFARLGPIRLVAPAGPAPLESAEVLIVRTASIDRITLAAAPRLRVIARTGVGVDNIDIAEATRRNVPVVVAPHAATLPVAEGTVALILAAAKRLGVLAELVRSGQWDQRYAVEVLDLCDSTIGIIGLGRIGSEVARLTGALGMRVLGYDPRGPRARPPWPGTVEHVQLDQLLATSDIVSLHCSLSPHTRGMVDAQFLRQLRPGAILVNATRGALVADEAALLKALDEGQLSGLALDVYASEPLDQRSPLATDPRVTCTPHSVGLSRRWNKTVFGSLAADVTRCLAGQPPQHIANPQVLGGGARDRIT